MAADRSPAVHRTDFTVANFNDFGRRAVVRQKHDQRIVQLTGLVEVRENATDILIDAVDHGAVNGHDPCLVSLLFGA